MPPTTSAMTVTKLMSVEGTERKLKTKTKRTWKKVFPSGGTFAKQRTYLLPEDIILDGKVGWFPE